MVATTLPAVVRIVDLPVGTSITGAELIEAVQTTAGVGVSVQLSLGQLTSLVAGLPTGGGTGQILNKTNASNFSSTWSSITQFVAVGTSLATTGSATSIVAFVANQGISSTQIANNAVGTNQVASSLGIASSLSVGGLLTVGGTVTVTGTTILNGGLQVVGTSLLTGNFSVYPSSNIGFDVNYNTGTVGVPSNSTTYLRLIGANGTKAALIVQSFGDNTLLAFASATGTLQAPVTVAADSVVGSIRSFPYNGATYNAGPLFQIATLNAQTATDASGYFKFLVIATGTTSPFESVRFQASGGVSIGTTHDPGIGRLEVNSGILVNGGTTLFTTSFGVVGTSQFTGSLSIVGTTLVTGSFGQVGTSLMTGLFGVVGTSIFTGSFGVVGTSTMTGVHNVVGTTLFTSGTFGVVGTSLFTGAFGVVGTSIMTGVHSVVGTSLFTAGTFGVVGTTLFTSTFGVVGTSLLTGSFGVVGTSIVTGLLTVSGTTTLSSLATGIVVASGTGVLSAQGGMVLLNTLSPNNVASTNDTTSFTSAYRSYMFVFNNVAPATNSTILQMQVSTSGSNFIVGSYLSLVNVVSINNLFSTTAFILSGQAATTLVTNTSFYGVTGNVYLYNPSSSVNRKSITGMLTHVMASTGVGTGTLAACNVYGIFDGNSNPVTGVNFSYNSGNIQTGVIEIFGIT